MSASNLYQGQSLMTSSRFKGNELHYFYELAGIVGDIDFDKNSGGQKIAELTDRAMNLLNKMKTQFIYVGKLQELFSGIQASHRQHMMLSTSAIEEVHDEIARLLGDDEWRIYYPD